MSSEVLLTPTESNRLKVLESTISRGQKSFIEVGTALAEIRDNKFYKTSFKTFESYCQEKWGWNSQRSRQLISAAETAMELQEKGTIVPISNEGQARELSKVPAAQRAYVLEKAAATGPVTARSIKAAAQPTIDVESTTEQENPGVRTRDQEIAAGEPECPTHETVDVVDGWLHVVEAQAAEMARKYPDRIEYIGRRLKIIGNDL